MTNTNDFRKYSYRNDPEMLISAFTYTRSSQAQKVAPRRRERETEIKVHEGKGIKSKTELKKEQKAANLTMIKIAAVALLCFFMIGLVLNSFALKNSLTREIAAQEVNVANAKSEYISLESELNSLVSISMIDKYAVDKLGMTKVKSNQIQYIDVAKNKAERAKRANENDNENILNDKGNK